VPRRHQQRVLRCFSETRGGIYLRTSQCVPFLVSSLASLFLCIAREFFQQRASLAIRIAKLGLAYRSRIVPFSSPVHNEPTANMEPTGIGEVSMAHCLPIKLISSQPILLGNPYLKPCIAHKGARMYVCLMRRSPGSMSFLTGSSSCKNAF
jgi:hypothetical protein